MKKKYKELQLLDYSMQLPTNFEPVSAAGPHWKIRNKFSNLFKSEIRKRSFISTVYFYRPHQSSRKRIRSFSETSALHFSVDGKKNSKRSLRKRRPQDNDVICPTEFSVIVAFSTFSSVVWTENICCVSTRWKRTVDRSLSVPEGMINP